MIRFLALLVLVPGFHAVRLQERSGGASGINLPFPSGLIRKALLASAANLSSNVTAKSAHKPCPRHQKMMAGIWKSVTPQRGSYMDLYMGEDLGKPKVTISSKKRRGKVVMPLEDAVKGACSFYFNFKEDLGPEAFIRTTFEIDSMMFLHHHSEVTCPFCGDVCVYPADDNDGMFGKGPHDSGLRKKQLLGCPIKEYLDKEKPDGNDPNLDLLLEGLPLESTHMQFTFSAFASPGNHMFDMVVSLHYECPAATTKHHAEKIDDEHAEEEQEAQEEPANK